MDRSVLGLKSINSINIAVNAHVAHKHVAHINLQGVRVHTALGNVVANLGIHNIHLGGAVNVTNLLTAIPPRQGTCRNPIGIQISAIDFDIHFEVSHPYIGIVPIKQVIPGALGRNSIRGCVIHKVHGIALVRSGVEGVELAIELTFSGNGFQRSGVVNAGKVIRAPARAV